MTDETSANEATPGAVAAPATAGSTLRSAREAAGLSVDDVALQLKLAPRQVQALEDDDFQHLPGRTFARGFARNYARFIQVDPDRVLALMPAGDNAAALERPSFAAARRPMGEIPVERTAKRSSSPRVLLLFAALVAIAGAALYYEYVHKAAGGRVDAKAPSVDPATTATLPSPQPVAAGTSTTTLPNPVATESATPATSPAVAPASNASATPDSTATPSSGNANAAAANDAALVLSFKGTSWAEVKDSNGRVILQMTGGAGMTQTVNGTPPLELSLGNAPEVAVTFRGQSLDLAPFTRGVVARVALK
ncbi:MAG TPA: RodZ domain-containing protein [Casimicrobiaceae bacterium]|nr:RodZ domain-containing protein [Casimicrobiaceae bacterium]